MMSVRSVGNLTLMWPYLVCGGGGAVVCDTGGDAVWYGGLAVPP